MVFATRSPGDLDRRTSQARREAVPGRTSPVVTASSLAVSRTGLCEAGRSTVPTRKLPMSSTGDAPPAATVPQGIVFTLGSTYRSALQTWPRGS